MNQTLPPLHGGSLQITLTVVLRLGHRFNVYNHVTHLYSDNQKTMEYEDDIIEILKRFDVVTKQICLLVT